MIALASGLRVYLAWGLRGVIKLEEKRKAEALVDLRKAVELKPSLKAAFDSSLEAAGRDE